jgi:hypothetical protein
MLQQCQWQKAQSALETWRSQFPHEPQLKVLEARLAYSMGNASQAEAMFREILRSATQAHILAEARKGLKQIEEDAIRRRKQRAEEIASAGADQGLGFLALLPVNPDNVSLRSKTVERLARIMGTDVYTASSSYLPAISKLSVWGRSPICNPMAKLSSSRNSRRLD